MNARTSIRQYCTSLLLVYMILNGKGSLTGCVVHSFPIFFKQVNLILITHFCSHHFRADILLPTGKQTHIQKAVVCYRAGLLVVCML